MQEQYGALLWGELLERRDDGEADVIAEKGGRFRVGRQRGEVVEGDRVDQLRERSRAPLPAEMIEAHRGRDAEEPSFGGGAVLEVVGTLDGARDRLLAQVVSLCAAPGHAVAVPPQALAAPLDGGQHGRGAFSAASPTARTFGRGRRVRPRISESVARFYSSASVPRQASRLHSPSERLPSAPERGFG